jgi:hypothetical protein
MKIDHDHPVEPVRHLQPVMRSGRLGEVPQPRSCKHARDTVEQPWESSVLSLVYDAQPDRVKLAPGYYTTRLIRPPVENVSYP